jgi:prepilin-type N-terminal cleavage/methylation domain-containing protein
MKKKGFTLMELMVALGILTLVMTYLYRTYFTQLEYFYSTNNKTQLVFESRTALKQLVKEFRTNDYLTLCTESNVVGSGTVINLIRRDANGAITDNSNFDITKPLNLNTTPKIVNNIYLQNGQLKDVGGSILCTGISSITFSQIVDANNVRINGAVGIKVTLTKGTEIYTVETSVNIYD